MVEDFWWEAWAGHCGFRPRGNAPSLALAPRCSSHSGRALPIFGLHVPLSTLPRLQMTASEERVYGEGGLESSTRNETARRYLRSSNLQNLNTNRDADGSTPSTRTAESHPRPSTLRKTCTQELLPHLKIVDPAHPEAPLRRYPVRD